MPISKIEQANINHAVSWKENSYELLISAKDEKSFADAVKWCGVGGGVIRTVQKDCFDNFARYVFENKENILSGLFDLRTTEAFNGVRPISWVSKICHILNPQQYPLIYDDFVKKYFHINNIEQFWIVLLNEREKYQEKHSEEIYRKEASIWAESITIENNK